jgi:hypothetical protein
MKQRAGLLVVLIPVHTLALHPHAAAAGLLPVWAVYFVIMMLLWVVALVLLMEALTRDT